MLDADQTNLYKLIWKRTVSSQMSNAILKKTQIKIKSSNRNDLFQTDSEVVKFDGVLKLYIEGKDNNGDNENNEELLPDLKVGEKLDYSTIHAQAQKHHLGFLKLLLLKNLKS